MPKPAPPVHQRGYMIEVPLMMAAVLILFSVLFPALPPLGKKALLLLVAAGLIFGLYYMIVVPGWRPGVQRRLPQVLRLAVFIILAGLVAALDVALFLGVKG